MTAPRFHPTLLPKTDREYERILRRPDSELQRFAAEAVLYVQSFSLKTLRPCTERERERETATLKTDLGYNRLDSANLNTSFPLLDGC